MINCKCILVQLSNPPVIPLMSVVGCVFMFYVLFMTPEGGSHERDKFGQLF